MSDGEVEKCSFCGSTESVTRTGFRSICAACVARAAAIVLHDQEMNRALEMCKQDGSYYRLLGSVKRWDE